MEGNRNGGLLQSLLFSGGNSGGGGGGGIFAVTSVIGQGSFGNANHKASEIYSAILSGQIPMLFITDPDGNIGYVLTVMQFVGPSGNPDEVIFFAKGIAARVNEDYTVEPVN